MEVEVSWLGVILATVASLVIGALWYAPFAFGKQWQKLVGLTDKQMKEGGGVGIMKAVVGGFITAYVLAHITYLSSVFYSGVSFTMSGALTGFYVWLGFSATTLLIHDGFELRPPKLTIMKMTSQLVTLVAMGLIIGLVGV
ncbi:MAG: DUF1761 domain-containing protein [Candidatus Saccharibacteria bacterium]|nr:DUF1761 domain-containing protein [Candidatus Saccharibacteria bacterium]